MKTDNQQPITVAEAKSEATLAAPTGSVRATPDDFTGFKFEHILISVTIAHNRSIGQFDDSCSHQIEKGMSEYQGILMVDAQAQYKHCSYDQHAEGCDCGLCQQVRHNDQAHLPGPL